MLLNEPTPQYTPPKPLYTIRRSPKNTLLTITSFIHSHSSIMCPQTNNILISIHEWFGISCFTRSKSLDINSFTNFRDNYSSYMYTTYNNECEFIKISYDPNLLDGFSLSINTALITTPQYYIKYLRVLSDIPYLTLQEGVCGTSSIDATPQYLLGMSPKKPKHKPHPLGAGILQYPYIHIIQEDCTYFLKFEFLSKLSDHEAEINALKQLWETDTNVIEKFRQLWEVNPHEAAKAYLHKILEAHLSAIFFQDSGIHGLSMEVTKCGNMFSMFFTFNLDNLDDDYDFLKDIPYTF